MWNSSEGSYSWRGSRGGRGRGRARGGFLSVSSMRGGWSGQGAPKPAFAASPEPSLGPLLCSLSKHDIDQEAKAYKSNSVITECRTVASYNWLDRTEPTIVIPGKPPKWTPLASPRPLAVDNGQYFRDVNSANFPKHPIEPAIIAALTSECLPFTATLHVLPQKPKQGLLEDFATDVVACGSTIGNLLRFLQGEDKPFRILVERIGETILFTRRENTPRELIPDVQGYGHSFPEAYTSWDPEVKGSTSHQRLLSYRFGGLGFLLRFEGDGYIVDEDSDEDDTSSESSRTSDSNVGGQMDLLSAQLAENRVTNKLPENTNSGLRVLRAGNLVTQDHIFDLKTRSIRKKETETTEGILGEQLKRLWVAQIPRFILAYHTRGVFGDINTMKVRDEVNDWEITHADMLSRLAALIHRIIRLVRVRSDHKLELRHDAVGILEIREQLPDVGDALSENAKRLWEDGEDQTSRESSPGFIAFDNDIRSEGSSTGDWDDGSEPDYTACSATDCGYCGRCSY